MQKLSLKPYFAAFLLILALSSFGFAGDSHCPVDPPPPPPGEDGRGTGSIAINTVSPEENAENAENYRFPTGFVEFLARNIF